MSLERAHGVASLFRRACLGALLAAGLFVAGVGLPAVAPRASAQGILPLAETQFVDGNGAPLAGGTVTFYVPGTTTYKTTYSDPGLLNANPNPVPLDGAGRAVIWGAGTYRQVVQDALGNTVWDQQTAGVNNSSWVGGAATTTGSAPNYLFAVPGVSSLTQGLTISWKASFTGTGGDALNLNSLGAKPLYRPSASGPIVDLPGDIRANAIVVSEFDTGLGTSGAWQVVGGMVFGGGSVTSVADAANGGILVTSPTTTPTLAVNPGNLLVKAVPTLADSALISDAGASGQAKTATVATELAARTQVIVQDRETSGSDGGALTASTWTDRTLNTLVLDTAGTSTLSSPNLTLQPGTYDVEASMGGCDNSASGPGIQSRLFNTTAGGVQNDINGNAIVSLSALMPVGRCANGQIQAEFTIAVASQLKFQSIVGATSKMGGAVSSGLPEVYTTAHFTRVQ